MWKWSSKYHWTTLVYVISIFSFTKDHSTTRSAECLVCCCSNDVCPFYRIVVTSKYFTSNETCKVCHIYHENCSTFVSNFSKAFKVDFSWVSRESCKKNQWFYFHCLFFDCIIVKKSCFFINTVWVRFEHSC